MKVDQLDVAIAFVEGTDVFAILPTGFGKSLCYACLPASFDKCLVIARIINYYMDWNPLYNRVKLFVTILVSPRTQTVQVTVFVVSYIVFCCNASV